MEERYTLGNIIGDKLEDDFSNFDMTEIKTILTMLKETNAIDIAHTEYLQQQALRGAYILTEYLARMIKTVLYLEGKVNTARNKAAMNLQSEQKITADMRRYAYETSPEAEEIDARLYRAKGGKAALEKQYDLLIKGHHHWKDMAAGMRKSILGYGNQNDKQTNPGWE